MDRQARFQQITAGFGVAMTDTSAYLLREMLSPKQRDQAMRRLFGRIGGIGLSFLRIPIGGSDYVVGKPYSYDDLPAGQTDPQLAHFSIAHDASYVLPAIRQALALNPAMSVMANPWTPPAWMKTDDALVTTTGPAGQLRPDFYGAYADYITRFVADYRAAGVDVGLLGVQNEPLTPLLLVAGIPESFLAPQDEGRLIRDFVVPSLRRAGVSPRILAYDDGYERDLAYIPLVMGVAGGEVSGFAYHCYYSDPASMAFIHSLYPDRLSLETECSSKLSNVDPAQMTIRALRNWAQGVQLWNAALDQHRGPKIGNGCAGVFPPFTGEDCTAPVTVDTSKHSYSLNADYWALGHFSKFVQPGAVRISSSQQANCPTSPLGGYDCGVENVALRNPDGSEVVVVTTHDGAAHDISISEAGLSVDAHLADGDTATFVWPAPVPRITGMHAGSSLRFTLSEDARVTVRIERLLGRRRVKAGTIVRAGAEGANSLPLRRRGGRPLRRGAYRLSVRAVDAGGDASRAFIRLRVR